jgi:hypothetical protein
MTETGGLGVQIPERGCMVNEVVRTVERASR